MCTVLIPLPLDTSTCNICMFTVLWNGVSTQYQIFRHGPLSNNFLKLQ